MKRAAVLSDLSGLGRCSLSAALPVLSVMGHECVAIPTAVLSAQTGFCDSYCKDLSEDIPRFADSLNRIGAEFDAIISGFITCTKQVDTIFDFISSFKKNDTLFICDPVMGDDGELYPVFDESIVPEMKRLCEKADIITPNVTELCLLCGIPCKRAGNMTDEEIKTAAACIGTDKTVIVTGVRRGESVKVFIVKGSGCKVMSSHYLSGSFSGTGDLFSSVLCGGLLRGYDEEKAVSVALDFIYKSVKDTVKERTARDYGVNFEKYLEVLL